MKLNFLNTSLLGVQELEQIQGSVQRSIQMRFALLQRKVFQLVSYRSILGLSSQLIEARIAFCG